MNTELEYTIDADGTQRWYLNGKLHRTDGPAEILESGTQYWCLNGKIHRADGPAAIYSDGRQYWHLNGKRYRNFVDWLTALNADDKTRTLLALKYS